MLKLQRTEGGFTLSKILDQETGAIVTENHVRRSLKVENDD